MADPSRPCDLHELTYCGVCHLPQAGYRRGRDPLNVPSGHYVAVRGGKGVYHHPDCYNVTGDWDGADLAALGDRLVLGPEEIRSRDLRPAQCCEPPSVGR